MPRALAICFVLSLLSVYVCSQDPSCKTFLECQARVHSWEQWSNENLPKCETAIKDAKRLEADNDKLQNANFGLQMANDRLEHTQIEVNLATVAVGVGVGAFCAFWLARALKRVWPVSYKGKQLVFMVCGAVWITGAALVVVNDSDLSKHPVNMLFTKVSRC